MQVDVHQHCMQASSRACAAQEEQQRVFVDARAELRAEQGFKALLEATPGITHAWPWPMVKRKVCSLTWLWHPCSLLNAFEVHPTRAKLFGAARSSVSCRALAQRQ
jgi:hypothetical protein